MTNSKFAPSRLGRSLDDVETPQYPEQSAEWKRFVKWRDRDPLAISSGMRTELAKVSGSKLVSGGYMICCPFHADKTPSCRVGTDPGRRNFGKFRCFGCPAHGTWFQLAERLNLDLLTGSQFETEFTPKFFGEYYEEAFLTDTGSVSVDDPLEAGTTHADDRDRKLGLYPIERDLAKRLGIQKEWRSIPTKLLLDIGAELEWWRSPKYPNMQPKWLLFLPVYVKGKRKGFICAELQKPKVKRPSYLNKGGEWSSRFGLFPFDYVINLMRTKETSTVVLVEGPRDALRLLQAGIPALAILGTQSWSERKIRLLEFAGVDRIITLFDGDGPGKQATEDIVPTITSRFDVHTVRLWVIAKSLGLKKLDPCELSPGRITAIRRQVFGPTLKD